MLLNLFVLQVAIVHELRLIEAVSSYQIWTRRLFSILIQMFDITNIKQWSLQPFTGLQRCSEVFLLAFIIIQSDLVIIIVVEYASIVNYILQRDLRIFLIVWFIWRLFLRMVLDGWHHYWNHEEDGVDLRHCVEFCF